MADEKSDRIDWQARFSQGQINLADAIFFYLQESSAPVFLIDSFHDACERYKGGEYSDLAEPFGLAMTKREKNREDRKTWVSHVRFHVDSFAEQGYPKIDPSHYDNTAFHKAGKLLCKSATQIYDTYYEK